MSKILFSSISKKIVMALAGFFLLIYLPIHLYVNLMLLKTDPVPFNTAAHFMATFPLIRALEIVLFAAFIVHIAWAILVQIQNWLARPIGYAKTNKANTSFFSRFMIWTGAVVLTFLVLHLFNFYFIKIGLVKGNAEDFYTVAHNLFKIPAYDYIYLGSFVLLGFHLYHALFSAFQTIGLSNINWSRILKVVAAIYAIIIPVGFAIISITIWLFR
jgi:succinate dehydrogenase / fumarate reductase, cytochrome b subunit